jgi:undecaprenyl-diphosphatase
MSPPPDPARALPARHALALGLLHGPAELLPVSSSGHVTLVPWLLGWPYPGLEPDLRKAFEVALHAGTALGLLIALRGEVAEALRDLDRRRVVLIIGSFVPPAIVGLTLEGPIERRLGTPGSIASGLLLGSIAMTLADTLAPQERVREQSMAVDALLLGLAQATALIPGTSRGGMTLAAMRARRFTRTESSALSRHVALPVIAGASVLKGARLARRGLPPGMTGRFALGMGASFASTLVAARLVPVERVGALWPYAAYRTGLATLTWRCLRRDGRSPGRR